MRNYPELAKALAEAPGSNAVKELIEEQIEHLSALVKSDAFIYRGPGYSRQTHTVALLLAGDPTIRALAVAKGIDVRAFDNIVGQVQQLLLEAVSKPTPGEKVAFTLRKFCGI